MTGLILAHPLLSLAATFAGALPLGVGIGLMVADYLAYRSFRRALGW